MSVKPRIVIEWVVFFCVVLVLVYSLVGEGSFLKGSVTDSGTYQYGYTYGYLNALRYSYMPGQEIILDGLSVQTPEYRLDNPATANFRWEISPTNPSCVFQGSTADHCSFPNDGLLYQYFVAPEVVGDYTFYLVFEDATHGDVYLGTFIITVLSPALDAADANDDGVYDLKDLIYVFQHWNSYPQVLSRESLDEGYDVSNVLAVLMCKMSPASCSQ